MAIGMAPLRVQWPAVDQETLAEVSRLQPETRAQLVRDLTDLRLKRLRRDWDQLWRRATDQIVVLERAAG